MTQVTSRALQKVVKVPAEEEHVETTARTLVEGTVQT